MGSQDAQIVMGSEDSSSGSQQVEDCTLCTLQGPSALWVFPEKTQFFNMLPNMGMCSCMVGVGWGGP